MKFHQLRPGTRFEYRQQTYRKVSPLKAANEADGTERLFARSAEVRPLDERGEVIAGLPAAVSGDEIERALARLVASLGEAAGLLDPPLNGQQRAALELAIGKVVDDFRADLVVRR